MSYDIHMSSLRCHWCDDQGNKATLNGEMLDQDVYHYIASHLVRGHHDHGQGPIRPKLWETSETLH